MDTILTEVKETDIIDGVYENHDVTEIGNGCFNNLPTLKKVVLPKVVIIGNNCFTYNDSLISINLPSLQTAGRNCFRCNISLTDLNLSSLQTIETDCFRYNKSLTNLNLPLLQTVGNDCFRYNNSLISINLPLLQTTGYYCFTENNSLTSLDLPSLQTVEDFCFSDNNSLTSINLPLLETAEDYCFRLNKSLTSLDLPSLQTVGDICFRYNDSLTSINLPSLKTTGNGCFTENISLTTINISAQNLNHLSVDGSPFIVQSEKKVNDYTVYSGYNLLSIRNSFIQKEECFVANKDNYFAHGKTIKKAIYDIEFKILTSKVKKEPIQMDTMFTVKYYRTLTGACDHGIRSWMKLNNIPFEVIINEDADKEETKELTPIKAIDLMPLLEQTNAYGYEKFKSLITW